MSGTGLSAADVIVTPDGITVYPPDAEGKPWRAVWYDPDGERRGCRATTESAMAAKLEPVKARIITEAHRTKAPVSQLVAHYLNPSRRPVDKQWAESTRYFETRRCQKILDAIGERPCESVKMADMQRLVNAESTATTGDKMMYTLKALVKMGYADGFITNPRLAMVHWQAGDRPMPPRKVQHAGEAETFIDPRTLPAHPAVAVLAAATQQRRASKWWEELFIYTAAYTGLRSGELRALRADRIQFSQRLINVLEKVVEVNGKQTLGLPKGDKIRTTLFPRRTPTGYLLAEQLARRAEEVRVEHAEGSNPLGLMFPARGGVHKREHSFHTTTLKPAYHLAGWRDSEGRGAWTLHTLRHVFCTTALNDWKIDVTDVSVLAGHANTRITLERYVSNTAGTFGRAFEKTD